MVFLVKLVILKYLKYVQLMQLLGTTLGTLQSGDFTKLVCFAVAMSNIFIELMLSTICSERPSLFSMETSLQIWSSPYLTPTNMLVIIVQCASYYVYVELAILKNQYNMKGL